MYIKNFMVKILGGHPKNITFLISENIDGFQTKRFTRLLEFINLYKQKPVK